MITQQNLKEVLEILGFEKLDSKKANIYTKTINSYIMQVDFTNQRLIYPQGIKKHDATTSNFSHPENFVVFECVHRLLEQGYKAESLELEKTWKLGHTGKSGRADITIYKETQDKKEKFVYVIIECKTAGKNMIKIVNITKQNKIYLQMKRAISSLATQLKLEVSSGLCCMKVILMKAQKA